MEAELELVFNETSSVQLPSSTEIVDTLKVAATSSTSGFNLTVVVSSISVLSKL